MVETEILIQIWKNRVKKIDFVLKWLSRVGLEVGPTKGEKKSRVENGRKEKKRREREREEREETEKDKKKSRGERREEPALYGEKGLVRDWSGKRMNAGGVESGI
ncbi:hypothetical protein TNCV_1667801 [Trichonephila clavipes]|nr:hypothetical protein TNCV_1667801 [Trichonephila clavipes]